MPSSAPAAAAAAAEDRWDAFPAAAPSRPAGKLCSPGALLQRGHLSHSTCAAQQHRIIPQRLSRPAHSSSVPALAWCLHALSWPSPNTSCPSRHCPQTPTPRRRSVTAQASKAPTASIPALTGHAAAGSPLAQRICSLRRRAGPVLRPLPRDPARVQPAAAAACEAALAGERALGPLCQPARGLVFAARAPQLAGLPGRPLCRLPGRAASAAGRQQQLGSVCTTGALTALCAQPAVPAHRRCPVPAPVMLTHYACACIIFSRSAVLQRASA